MSVYMLLYGVISVISDMGGFVRFGLVWWGWDGGLGCGTWPGTWPGVSGCPICLFLSAAGVFLSVFVHICPRPAFVDHALDLHKRPESHAEPPFQTWWYPSNQPTLVWCGWRGTGALGALWCGLPGPIA